MLKGLGIYVQPQSSGSLNPSKLECVPELVTLSDDFAYAEKPESIFFGRDLWGVHGASIRIYSYPCESLGIVGFRHTKLALIRCFPEPPVDYR